jgi:hypothetical protein
MFDVHANLPSAVAFGPSAEAAPLVARKKRRSCLRGNPALTNCTEAGDRARDSVPIA